MRILRYTLWLPLLMLSLIIGCQSVSLPVDIADKAYERLEEYGLRKLTDDIRDSDFCVAGQIHIKSKETLHEISIADKAGNIIGKEPDKWKMTGEVEVTSVVYGNPGTKTIPFSTIQTNGTEWRFDVEESDEYPFFRNKHTKSGWDAWFFLFPNEGDTFIIIGKGQGKDAMVTRPIKPIFIRSFTNALPTEPGRAELVNTLPDRVEAIRIIRDVEVKPESEQKEARQKLLAESNNNEVLVYLFCRGFKEDGLDRQIDIVKTLFSDNVTPERRFIAYWLANTILSPPGPQSSRTESIPYPPFKYLLKITPEQREVLNEIIIKSLAGIKTLDEGVIYIRSLSPGTLAKDKALEERVKKIVAELSRQFKGDKAYPKWETQVKKIFPGESLEN